MNQASNNRDYRDNEEWRKTQEQRPTAELLSYKRSLVSFASRIDDSRPDALELYEKLLDRVEIISSIINSRTTEYKDRDQKIARIKRFFSEYHGSEDANHAWERTPTATRGARYDDPPPKHRKITPLVPSMPASCLPGGRRTDEPHTRPSNEPVLARSRSGSSSPKPTVDRPINDESWENFQIVDDEMEQETQKDE